jgi:hypothetical protein
MISTLGPKPRTCLKKKVHKMEENLKFLLPPCLHSVNWLFMLANSEVHQSYIVGMKHYTGYNISDLDSWRNEVDPMIHVRTRTRILRLRLFITRMGS